MNLLAPNTKKEEISNLCNCNIYYTSSLFNNLCSGCFDDKYPIEYNKIIKKGGALKIKYKLKELDEQIKEYKISERNGFLRGIELILNNYNKVNKEQQKIAYNNICKLLNQIIKLNKGLTTEQAGKIYNICKGILGNNKDWKLQHLIAGFVIDPWNITSNECGSISFCYYGYNIPYKEDITNIQLIPVIYHNAIQKNPTIFNKATFRYNKLNDIERGQYERYKLWISNMPIEFKNMIKVVQF